MKRILFSVLVLASLLLAACGGAAPAGDVKPPSPPVRAGTAVVGEEGQATPAPTETLVPTVAPEFTATPDGDAAMATVLANAVETALAGTASAQAILPEPTNTPTPTSTNTPAPSGLPLHTAEDIRALGEVLGWVTGGDTGQWVAGAQLELKEDTLLRDILQEGVVYEFQCVHYLQINGVVHAKPVCEDGLVRFSTDSVLPAGAVGTLWLPWAVQGSATEEWLEGFLNKPCVCKDGDCRDD